MSLIEFIRSIWMRHGRIEGAPEESVLIERRISGGNTEPPETGRQWQA